MTPSKPTLADVFGKPNDAFPEDMIGATIVRIGSAIDPWGGGLILEYIPVGTSQSRELVLAFNELGMWFDTPRHRPETRSAA